MLNISAAALKERTSAFAATLSESLDSSCSIAVIEQSSCVGGGALPTTDLPGWGIALRCPGLSLEAIALELRRQNPAVVARIQDEALIFNLRTVFPEQQQQLASAISQALATLKNHYGIKAD